MDSIHQHFCFGVYDNTYHVLSIDEAGNVLMTSIKNIVFLCYVNSTKFLLQSIVSFYSYRLDKSIQKNVMKTSSTACQNKQDLTENENINVSKAQKIDEELISLVQQRPALYDYRIPTQERTKFKKNDLWQEVSNCLAGKTYGLLN